MKNRKTSFILALLLAAIVVLTSACGTGSSTGVTTASSAAQTTAGENLDPLGKYNPTIDVSTVQDHQDSWVVFDKGDTPEDNIWTRTYLNELGIKVKVLWAAPSDQSPQKLNLLIASGGLPDVFHVNDAQLEQLISAGQLADLKDAFDKYASPQVKELFNADGGTALSTCTRDGKLYGIPFAGENVSAMNTLWLRNDWMQKLGLQPPKTVDDMENIMKTFMDKDPDGVGKDKVYGLQFDKDLIPETYFNMFHAYPGAWVKDSSGKLVEGKTLPGMKDALLRLQKWYKEGLIPKQFGVIDYNKMSEDWDTGKVGMGFSSIYTPAASGAYFDKHLTSTVITCNTPSADSTPASIQVPKYYINWYTVVKKDMAHPEAAIKMLNLHYKLCLDMTCDKNPDYKKLSNIWIYSFLYVEPSRNSYSNYKALNEYLKNRDTSKMTPGQRSICESWDKYFGGDNSQWWVDTNFGPHSGWPVVEYCDKNNLYAYNEFTGQPTPSMIEKGPTLTKMYQETVTKIVMGADIGEWDKFLDTWKKLGGDATTKEVNDWYAKQSK